MFPIKDVATATDDALKCRAYFLYRFELELDERGRGLNDAQLAELAGIRAEQARRAG